MLVVQFSNIQNNISNESEGPLIFTVVSLVPSDRPFSVQVCTRDGVLPFPFAAEGLLKISLT